MTNEERQRKARSIFEINIREGIRRGQGVINLTDYGGFGKRLGANQETADFPRYTESAKSKWDFCKEVQFAADSAKTNGN